MATRPPSRTRWLGDVTTKESSVRLSVRPRESRKHPLFVTVAQDQAARNLLAGHMPTSATLSRANVTLLRPSSLVSSLFHPKSCCLSTPNSDTIMPWMTALARTRSSSFYFTFCRRMFPSFLHPFEFSSLPATSDIFVC